MLTVRALAVAVGPTARTSHLGSAAVTVLLGAVPTGVVLARGDSSMAVPMVVAALSAGAALGWACEDPSAEVLGALPVSSAVRSWMRALSILALVAVMGVALLVVVAAGPGFPPDIGGRLVEGATAAGAALALGLALNRRREAGAGVSGVAAGVLAPAVVAALSYRWPDVLPSFGAGPVHGRWWLIVAGLAPFVVWGGRDPARR